MKPIFPVLDLQMRRWSTRLRDDLGLSAEQSNGLASAISHEIEALPAAIISELRCGSPTPLKSRLDELRAFQAWMEIVDRSPKHPGVTRAQVITQNYICFVYLGEFLFKPLVKHSGAGTVIRRCCKFLTENPVRAFRNAIAHSNWRYTDDYRGLVFWAKKGGDAEEPMVEWVVLQEDLNFWQALARSTAYVILSRIEGI